MTQEQQEDFLERVKEVQAFAKEKEILLSAVQQVNKENGYLETVVLYKDLKRWVKDVTVSGTEEVKTNEPTGTE